MSKQPCVFYHRIAKTAIGLSLAGLKSIKFARWMPTLQPGEKVVVKIAPLLPKVGMAGVIAMPIMILALAVYAGYLAFVTQHWPVASARVLQSEIVESQRTSEGELGSRIITRFTINITYAYSVEGRDYTSNRAGFFTTLNTKTQIHAEELRNRYLAGSEVAVHYNPDAPGQVVLLVGWQAVPRELSVAASFIVFLGMAACGSGLWCLFEKRNLRKLSSSRRGNGAREKFYE